jgi:hypothetical protein
MKTIITILLASTAMCGFTRPVYADDFNPPISIAGHIVSVYADPSDFVVEIDNVGICASTFFNIQRDQVNFKEVTALLLAAFSSYKRVNLFVKSCSGGRNILSHGGAFD